MVGVRREAHAQDEGNPQSGAARIVEDRGPCGGAERRLNPRARRLIVKVHPTTGEVTVTAPSQRALDKALEFARGQSDWIARQLSHVPALVKLGAGRPVAVQGCGARGAPGRASATCRSGSRTVSSMWRARTSIIRAACSISSNARRARNWKRALPPIRRASGSNIRGSPCATPRAAGVRVRRSVRCRFPGG